MQEGLLSFASLSGMIGGSAHCAASQLFVAVRVCLLSSMHWVRSSVQTELAKENKDLKAALASLQVCCTLPDQHCWALQPRRQPPA